MQNIKQNNQIQIKTIALPIENRVLQIDLQLLSLDIINILGILILSLLGILILVG